MTYTHERTLTERHTEYNNTNTVCRYTRLHTKYLSAPFFRISAKRLHFKWTRSKNRGSVELETKYPLFFSSLLFTFVSKCFWSNSHANQRSAQNTNKYLKRVFVSLSVVSRCVHWKSYWSSSGPCCCLHLERLSSSAFGGNWLYKGQNIC